MADSPTTEPFNLLFVCTANHCRSPMAEYLFRQRAQSLGLDWSVGSAGTRALIDQPMHPHALEILDDAGLGGQAFRGRQCTLGILRGVDLVLTMDDEQRNWVVLRHPPALNRTFNLLQFAHLLKVASITGHQEDLSGPELLRRARDARPRAGALSASRSVDDPMGHGYWRFATCAHRLAEAIDVILPSRPRGA